MSAFGSFVSRVGVALGVALAGLSVWAGVAVAGPVWDLEAHHAPTVAQGGEQVQFTFLASNVGDSAADQSLDDNGTPGDPSDDRIRVEIDLPDGVTTRLQETVFNGPQSWWAGYGSQFEPAWDCGPAVAGASSVSCVSLQERVLAGTYGLGDLRIYAQVDPSATGELVVEARLTGGGAAPVTVSEAVAVGPVPDRFGIIDHSFKADAFDKAGVPIRQAGAHPFRATTAFDFNMTRGVFTHPFPGGEPPLIENVLAVGSVRDIDVKLPRGFVGNPQAVSECRIQQFVNGACPTSSQIGTVTFTIRATLGTASPAVYYQEAVYNIKPDEGQLALFRFRFDGRPVTIEPTLDPRDHSIVAKVRNIVEAAPPHSQRLTIWGNPSDPVHDSDRFNPQTVGWGAPFGAERKPFLTLPSQCETGDSTKITRLNSWQEPGLNAVPAGGLATDPVVLSGCEASQVTFKPSMTVQPTSREAGAPTGLEVVLSSPQAEDGIATPPLKQAAVTLPEGMAVNPSSADGLDACSEAQIGLGTDNPVGCPEASKVGSVEVETPVLAKPVKGSVYLAQQGNRPGQGSNPFGSLLALYMVVDDPERGLLVKLPGRVTADPDTGRLRAVFDENPQLPFNRLALSFKSGSRAPLVNPPTCGTYQVASQFTSWAQPQIPVVSNDSFQITSGADGRPCPAGDGFDPGFTAGSVDPIAGVFSPLVTQVTRDGGKDIGRIDVTLPKGALAKLKGVPLCTGAQIAGAAGRPGRSTQATPSCPAGSQVGTTTVGAGAGSTPFFPRLPGSDVSGRVFLTGPHTSTEFPVAGARQAAYGLAIEVPAVAGPFDVGTVMVRAAIYVDPKTAQVTVVSDRLPRILEGIPLNVRDIRVDIDRKDFALTPSGCSQKQVGAVIRAQDGTAVARTARYRVGDCASLAFKPKLTLRLTGRRQVKTGRHPGVRAQVAQTGIGEAGIAKAVVKLPKSLALDPDNAQALCEFEDGTKPDLENHCPKGSIVGRAKATTPLLNKALAGNVYFVKNIRTDKRTGNKIRTLPMIVVALRGEIAINLRGESSTAKKTGQLVNTFNTVPDAPITRFNLNIAGGNKGILAVTRTRKARINLCANPTGHKAQARLDGHNTTSRNTTVTVKTPCAKAAKQKPKRLRLKRDRR